MREHLPASQSVLQLALEPQPGAVLLCCFFRRYWRVDKGAVRCGLEFVRHLLADAVLERMGSQGKPAQAAPRIHMIAIRARSIAAKRPARRFR